MVYDIPLLSDENDPDINSFIKKKYLWDQLTIELGYTGNIPLDHYYSNLQKNNFNSFTDSDEDSVNHSTVHVSNELPE
jgi:hypothetical protein